MASKKKIIIGLVDADLLCKGTRHPNLVLLKLAGYFRDHDIQYELVINNDVDLDKYRYVYLSRVFTFTTMTNTRRRTLRRGRRRSRKVAQDSMLRLRIATSSTVCERST